MTEPVPSQPKVESGRRRLPRISATWLVPLLALAVSLSVAWRSYSDRGPLIEILFDSASGISAQETKLRFKDFDVGTVENVSFTPDLSKVVVSVRLDKEIADYVDEDAQFWLVKARVGPQGISGLSTVLSGAYIEGSWNATKGERQFRFTALSRPPQTPMDAPGIHIRLRAPNGGSIAVGAPILFKQIPVGTVEDVELTEAGDVMVSAFIRAPNDRRLTTLTRFWNASGFSIQLGAAGASLQVESLASLVQGGISFDTVNSGGAPIEQEHIFQLYGSESDARSTLITQEEGGAAPVELSAIFEGTVSGLKAGADVQYRGVPVGQVTGLEARIVERNGGPAVDLVTTFNILPNRIGVNATDASARDLTLETIANGVRNGLRAKLARAGLISPALYIDLVIDKEAEPATFDPKGEPLPMVPTIPTDEFDLLSSAQGLMDEVASLPINDMMESIITLIGNINALVTDEAFKAVPGNIGSMVSELRDGGAIANVNAAIASLRSITDQIAAAEISSRLDALIVEANAAMGKLNSASGELPKLIDSVQTLSDKANALPLDQLIQSATRLVDTADGLLASTGMKDLPPRLADALKELELTLAELREGGTVKNVNATLASASDAADAIAVAAADLPALVQRLNETVARADLALASVGPNSTLNRDTLSLLADVRSAARAVQSLATALERQPNSLLFGR